MSRSIDTIMIGKLYALVIPIGYIYTQWPDEPSPLEMWGGTHWKDVSYKYANTFPRNHYNPLDEGAKCIDNMPLKEAKLVTTQDWGRLDVGKMPLLDGSYLIYRGRWTNISGAFTYHLDYSTIGRINYRDRLMQMCNAPNAWLWQRLVGNAADYDARFAYDVKDFDFRPRNVAVKLWQRVE